MTFSIFGFGSLVSRASIAVPVQRMEPARIFGYRRSWCQPSSRHGRQIATLGLQPGAATDYVDGVSLVVDAEHAGYFQEREAGYRHIDVEMLHSDGRTATAVSFETREHAPLTALIPVSYIATVVAGFWDVYGEERGLAVFLENTAGWERQVLFDLAAPTYPRAPANLTQIAAAIRQELASITDIVEQ